NADDIKLNRITKTKRINIESSGNDYFDITDIKQQIIHINNYMSKQTINGTQISEKMRNIIIDLHKIIAPDKNNFYSDDRSWRLLEIKCSNMFCYDKGNVIDFTGFPQNKVIGIVAENHYGKSSIVDIILYAICGKC